MVTGARPITWTKNQPRCLTQAGARGMGVECLQRKQLASQLLMPPIGRWLGQVLNGSQLVGQAVVADDIETKDHRACGHSAFDDVKPHRPTDRVEQDMLTCGASGNPSVEQDRIEGR